MLRTGVRMLCLLALAVPAGTPRTIIDKIAADISRIITRPDLPKKFVAGVVLTLLDQGSDQFAEFLKVDRENYAVRVKNINVKLD